MVLRSTAGRSKEKRNGCVHLVSHKIRSNLSTFNWDERVGTGGGREGERTAKWCVEDVANDDDDKTTTTTTAAVAEEVLSIHQGTIYEILFVQFTDDIIVNQSCFVAKVPYNHATVQRTLNSTRIQLNFPSVLLILFIFCFLHFDAWHKVTFSCVLFCVVFFFLPSASAVTRTL